MAWISLMFAGLLEIVWAFSMKQSDGFTRLVPSAVTVVAMIASVVLLAYAMKTLPLGTAYTIWTGIGAVGAFVVGIAVLGEQAQRVAHHRGRPDRVGTGADEVVDAGLADGRGAFSFSPLAGRRWRAFYASRMRGRRDSALR